MRDALALAAGLFGCTAVTSRPPPPREDWNPNRPRECGTTAFGLAGDFLGFAVVSVTLLSGEPDDGSDAAGADDRDMPSPWLLALPAAVFGGSIAYGIHLDGECEPYEAFLNAGCVGDADCKAGRRCVAGACASPAE